VLRTIKVLLLLLFLPTLAYTDSGFYIRSDCDVLSAVNNRTICQQYSTAGGRSPGLYRFTSSVWTIVIDETANYDYTGKLLEPVAIASLPAAGTKGRLRFVNDSQDVGPSCDSAGGTLLVLCQDDGTNWVPIASIATELQDLDAVFDLGKIIDGATSFVLSMRVGGATDGIAFYDHPTNGPTIVCFVAGVEGDCDLIFRIDTDNEWILKDVEGGADIEKVDPDAASKNLIWVYPTGTYRPLKTVYLGADALYVIGAATLTTDTALISGGEVAPYIVVTDVDTDGFQRSFRMPGSYDGGTITATISLISVNGTPANNFEVDVSGECWGNSDVRTTIDTTGEVAANFDFDASGTCGGSACVTNEVLQVTTAAITLNGTPAAGDVCGFQALVDATATDATVADIKITDLNIHYSVDSRSD